MIVPNRKTITSALVEEVAGVLKIRTSRAGSRSVWEGHGVGWQSYLAVPRGRVCPTCWHFDLTLFST